MALCKDTVKVKHKQKLKLKKGIVFYLQYVKVKGMNLNYDSGLDIYLVLSRSHMESGLHGCSSGGSGVLLGVTEGIWQLGLSMSFASQ